MLGEGRVYAGCEVAQCTYLSLNTGLCDNVVVLNAVEEFGETPKGVGFDGVEYRFR